MHSEAAKPPFRGRHGAGAQGIPAAVRPAASGGVHGRDEQAARGGSPREVAGTPRVAGEVRRPTTSAGENVRCGCSASRCPTAGRWPSPNGAQRWIGRSKRALANLPRYRDAETITLVCDNLNTHNGDSFYAAFPAAEASRLNDRIHLLVHTPKHGSWLNVAELEFSAFCTASAWIAGSRAGLWSRRKRRPGPRSAIANRPGSTGSSASTMRAPN